MDITTIFILYATAAIGLLKVAALAYGIVLIMRSFRKPAFAPARFRLHRGISASI